MRNYPALCRLKLSHLFYASGTTSDFAFKADADTEALMRGYKLLVRQNGSELTILFEAVDDARNPLVNYPEVATVPVPQRLRFYMMVKNPAVLGYTHLPGYDQSKVIAHRFKADATIVVDPASQQKIVRPKVFMHPTTGTLTVNGPQDADGGVGPLVINKTGLATGNVEVDLTAFSAGIYTVDNGSPITYMVDSHINQSVFAVVELFPLHAAEQAYTLDFTPATAIWKYFLVHRGGIDSGTDYLIKQTGASGQEFANAGDEAALQTEFDGESDPIVKAELAQDIARIKALKEGEISGTEVNVWRSVSTGTTTVLKLPLSETPTKSIELSDLTASNVLLVPHLPNPPLDSPGRGVPVFID